MLISIKREKNKQVRDLLHRLTRVGGERKKNLTHVYNMTTQIDAQESICKADAAKAGRTVRFNGQT